MGPGSGGGWWQVSRLQQLNREYRNCGSGGSGGYRSSGCGSGYYSTGAFVFHMAPLFVLEGTENTAGLVKSADQGVAYHGIPLNVEIRFVVRLKYVCSRVVGIEGV